LYARETQAKVFLPFGKRHEQSTPKEKLANHGWMKE
jgi:hypothetical protein